MDAPRIRIPNEKDSLVRDGLILAFFTKASIERVAEGFLNILNAWMNFIPKEKLAWYHGAAWAYKPIKKNTISRFRNMLKKEKVLINERITGFTLMSDTNNPDYLIDITCKKNYSLDTEDNRNDTNYIEMRFPTETLEGEGLQRFVEFCLHTASLLEFDSGYASLGLNGFGDNEIAMSQHVPALAFRYPGFDVNKNNASIYTLGRFCRGARWLTFLGQPLIEQLGGVSALQQQLSPYIAITPTGKGVMIRAGEYPDVGDAEQGHNLPLLRSLAKAIKPVTLFDDSFIYKIFDKKRNPESARRWERRFLD